jgi:hypothetical protein
MADRGERENERGDLSPISDLCPIDLVPLEEIDSDETMSETPPDSNVVAKLRLESEGCGREACVGALVGERVEAPEASAAGSGATGGGEQAYPAADLAGRLMDLRGVGKFPTFNGQDADWAEWRFRFQVGADMLDLGDHMQMALQEPNAIPMGNLNKDSKQRAKLLYGILVQVCSGRALGIIRTVRGSNGLEAWRALCAE